MRDPKLRLLLLERMFLQETDETHPLSLEQIHARLAANGLDAERKTLYADIQALTDAGIEILRDEKNRYYTESRRFETAELKLLSDAVAASRFLTAHQSEQLRKRLLSLAGPSSSTELDRQLLVSGKSNTVHREVLYNVDALHDAIRQDRGVSFLYFDWSVEKKKRYHHDGERIAVSPWALVWDDERYYLIAYDGQAETLKHYRVDKMEKITLTDQKRIGKQAFLDSDPERYTDRVFGMFGGKTETVMLRAEQALSGMIIDKFGWEVPFLKDADGYFRVPVKVDCSPNFYAWVFSFRGRMRILSPAWAKQEFQSYLNGFSEEPS